MGVIGEYSYPNYGNLTIVVSVLTIFHVFFSKILLTNFLIAILSSTYDNMRTTGIFRYKVNLHQYCERFIVAFNESGYGESIIHPPPISYLSAMMIPFFPFKKAMPYISKSFSYFNYWLENLIFGVAFLLFEVVIMPIAYLKVWYNIIKNSMGLLNTLVNCFIWAVIGIFMMIFLIFRDVFYLFKIFSYH